MVRHRVADVRGREAGFSLSELIVVIAMIGVLAALGLPQFMSYWRTSATGAAASELATAINRARQLAISGNQNYCAEVSASSVRYRQNANATCTARNPTIAAIPMKWTSPATLRPSSTAVAAVPQVR